MGTIHILKADGTAESKPGDRLPPFDELKKIVDGPIEFVWVLYKDKRTCMIVNECGSIAYDKRGPLPVNQAATDIYHTWGRSQGKNMIDAPCVHVE